MGVAGFLGTMNGLTAGIALALAASLALNTGYLFEHSGLTQGPDIDLRHPLVTLRWMFASRPWLAGLLLATFGWVLHVSALSKAPLSLVQAFVAGGLVLALPIGRLLFSQRLGRTELGGICVLAVALAALALGIDEHGAHGSFSSSRLAIYLAVSLAAAAALGLAPAHGRRAQMLGLAGGLLYGAADVAIKALTGIDSTHGLGHALLTGWLVIAVVTTLAAAYCFQRGLQIGPALPVIALMTAATNVLSIVAGFVVFGDPLGRTPGLAAIHTAALVVIVVAAARLAPAQAERKLAPVPV